jgi:N-acetylglucosamine-6-sulfatase
MSTSTLRRSLRPTPMSLLSFAALIGALVVSLLPVVPWTSVARAQAASDSPAPLGSAGSASSGQPDIIVVMVDDLGFIPDDRVLERLPAIQQAFLEDGQRLEGMNGETPLCCPSRATFLTGSHTLHHGITANDGNAFDASDTLATRLDAAGYHTMLVGKYLNEYEGTRTPPGWDRVMMREEANDAVYSIDGERVEFTDVTPDEALHQQAVTWISEAPRDEPLFALLTPRAPHRHPQKCEDDSERGCQYLPFVAEEDQGSPVCAGLEPWKPPDYTTDVERRPVPWGMPRFEDGWPTEVICESLLVVDRMVADVVAAQAERGRPAYLVFMSDNGMSWGRKGKAQKHVPTATQLPFYVAGPGVAVGASQALASTIDIAPTLAELASVELGVSDGQSLVPILHDPAADGREEMLEIMPADPDGFYEGWAALRTPAWRYIRWDSGVRELYDLAADPWEMANLVEQDAARAEQMDARLDELIEGSRT